MSLSAEERERLHARLRAYSTDRDPAVRDEIVESQMRLAIHLARRFEHRGIPFEDLVQVASLGLLKSVERFEPERGLEFSTFATPTIMGELKRHFRDKGWEVRVPRKVQELHVRLNVVVNELTQQLGRSPSIPELATATRASQEEVLEALEASNAFRSTSIDAAVTEDGTATLADVLGVADRGPDLLEDRDLVERLLASLPPRERLMMQLRFYEELTQSEIAERLGISQMHVSRLLGRCLENLRLRLAAEGIEGPPT
ncbi:MAG: SigB/SigF/SigG family RNA polymerase sigma factor [Acidimicrobiales bacterium]|nr:SigB/SigF/SigG family RNA polymerase sigma factor [Acidimicrobiales bacterium]